MSRKIVLDTDPGVGIPGTDADDPIALLFALADPRLELLGVTTTFGNCPPWLGARGARKVLDAAGRPDLPVAAGLPQPLAGRLPAVLAEAYEGPRGRVGNIELPETPAAHATDAPRFLIDAIHAHPGEVTIVAIGPQTNIATAMLLDPTIKDELAGIVFMGGALGLDAEFGRGNVTSVAECNVYFDPQAADIVFESGVPLTMVSLDVTNPATGLILREDVIRAIDRTASPAADLFAAVCETYLEAPMFDWGHGCVLYDPLAVLAAADPGVGTYQDMSVHVETQGRLTLGQTVAVPRAAENMRVMVDVDGHAAVDEIVRTIATL